MPAGWIAGLLLQAAPECALWSERIDLYDPRDQSYLGSEITDYAPDGRRLRQTIRDGAGARSLAFLVLHDEDGRESVAWYFEGEADTPSRERFLYAEDGRMRTTAYDGEDGGIGERTESDLDADGREFRKRYYRADGSLYGVEDVLWMEDGRSLGWEFRYVEREGGASFRYAYAPGEENCGWRRRVRSRDGEAERIEMRTPRTAADRSPALTPLRFALGAVSTGAFETSPSFSSDGRRMVFARYGEDWGEKIPYLAESIEDRWNVRPITGLDTVYNLAISPDGDAVLFSSGDDGRIGMAVLSDTSELGPDEAAPVGPIRDLSAETGVTGSYLQMTSDGRLVLYDPAGAEGGGLYVSIETGGVFGPPAPMLIPSRGTVFDGAVDAAGRLVFAQCVDDACDPSPQNGLFVRADGDPVRIDAIGYAWGATPVPALGLLVFTDGEDILAIPLSATPLGD